MKNAWIPFISLLVATSSWAESFKPNNGFSGPLYRSLKGPKVSQSRDGTKSVLTRLGTAIIECQKGPSGSYNDYDCVINVSELSTRSAQTVFESLNGPAVQVENQLKSILLAIYPAHSCGFTICQKRVSLVCQESGACFLKSELTGWND